MFVAWENTVCTLKWPSLKAKIGKTKKSKFGRIDSSRPHTFRTLLSINLMLRNFKFNLFIYVIYFDWGCVQISKLYRSKSWFGNNGQNYEQTPLPNFDHNAILTSTCHFKVSDFDPVVSIAALSNKVLQSI